DGRGGIFFRFFAGHLGAESSECFAALGLERGLELLGEHLFELFDFEGHVATLLVSASFSGSDLLSTSPSPARGERISRRWPRARERRISTAAGERESDSAISLAERPS